MRGGRAGSSKGNAKNGTPPGPSSTDTGNGKGKQRGTPQKGAGKKGKTRVGYSSDEYTSDSDDEGLCGRVEYKSASDCRRAFATLQGLKIDRKRDSSGVRLSLRSRFSEEMKENAPRVPASKAQTRGGVMGAGMVPRGGAGGGATESNGAQRRDGKRTEAAGSGRESGAHSAAARNRALLERRIKGTEPVPRGEEARDRKVKKHRGALHGNALPPGQSMRTQQKELRMHEQLIARQRAEMEMRILYAMRGAVKQ